MVVEYVFLLLLLLVASSVVVLELKQKHQAQMYYLRAEVTHLCAEMVASAKRATIYEGQFEAGYQQAQQELAEMLRQVARGEITLEMARERHAVQEKSDEPDESHP